MLIDYMPDYYDDVTEMIALLKAEQPAFDKLGAQTDRMLLNRFVDQADSQGLAVMETELHIDTDLSLSLETRRYAIKMRLLPPHPITFKYLKDLVASFNIPAELTRDVHRQILETFSENDTITDDQIDRLRYLLNVYLPANMEYTINTLARTENQVRFYFGGGVATTAKAIAMAGVNTYATTSRTLYMAGKTEAKTTLTINSERDEN